MGRCWIGAVPDGKDASGLALPNDAGELRCDTVSCVEHALPRIIVNGELLGLGIDAPMWWSAREGGSRCVDDLLRSRYRISSGTVQTLTSLMGAALVVGALLASRVRQAFPGTHIADSHPKALLLTLAFSEEIFAEEYEIPIVWQNEHGQDAAIAAACAREGFKRRWHPNLAEWHYPSEQGARKCWIEPIFYFWPERI